MYENVGQKIKSIVSTVSTIGIAAACLIGFAVMVTGCNSYYGPNGFLIFMGIVIMVLGSFIVWLNSLVIYAFGQMVDNSDECRKLLQELVGNKETGAPSDADKEVEPVDASESTQTGEIQQM